MRSRWAGPHLAHLPHLLPASPLQEKVYVSLLFQLSDSKVFRVLKKCFCSSLNIKDHNWLISKLRFIHIMKYYRVVKMDKLDLSIATRKNASCRMVWEHSFKNLSTQSKTLFCLWLYVIVAMYKIMNWKDLSQIPEWGVLLGRSELNKEVFWLLFSNVSFLY